MADEAGPKKGFWKKVGKLVKKKGEEPASSAQATPAAASKPPSQSAGPSAPQAKAAMGSEVEAGTIPARHMGQEHAVADAPIAANTAVVSMADPSPAYYSPSKYAPAPQYSPGAAPAVPFQPIPFEPPAVPEAQAPPLQATEPLPFAPEPIPIKTLAVTVHQEAPPTAAEAVRNPQITATVADVTSSPLPGLSVTDAEEPAVPVVASGLDSAPTAEPEAARTPAMPTAALPTEPQAPPPQQATRLASAPPAGFAADLPPRKPRVSSGSPKAAPDATKSGRVTPKRSSSSGIPADMGPPRVARMDVLKTVNTAAGPRAIDNVAAPRAVHTVAGPRTVNTVAAPRTVTTIAEPRTVNTFAEPRTIDTQETRTVNTPDPDAADGNKHPEFKRVRMELENAKLQRQVLQLEAELRKERGDKDSPHQAELTKYKTRTRTLEMNLKSEQGRNSARIAELTAQAEKAAEDVAAAGKDTAECRVEIAALKGKKRALEQELKDALDAGARADKKAAEQDEELQATRAQLERVQKKADELEADLTEAEAQGRSSKQNMQELLAALKARNAELEGAERLLNEARIKQEETAREMEAARLEVSNSKEQLEGAWKLAEDETHRAQQLETEVFKLTCKIAAMTGEGEADKAGGKGKNTKIPKSPGKGGRQASMSTGSMKFSPAEAAEDGAAEVTSSSTAEAVDAS